MHAGAAGYNVHTVEIGPVTGPVPNEAAKDQIASIFADDLRNKGYTVIKDGVVSSNAGYLESSKNPSGVASPGSTDSLEGTANPPSPADAGQPARDLNAPNNPAGVASPSSMETLEGLNSPAKPGPKQQPAKDLNAPNNPVGVASPTSTSTLEGLSTPAAEPATWKGPKADAVLAVTVTQWGENIAISATLADSRTGKMPWCGSGNGNVENIWATAGGAAECPVPGAAGAEPQTMTAGQVQGVAGRHFLSPKEEFVTKHIAAKMLTTLPSVR
jgi:hypothetical protein